MYMHKLLNISTVYLELIAVVTMRKGFDVGFVLEAIGM